MKKAITWVLVANGVQARVFCNDGHGQGIKEVEGSVMAGRNLQGREIVADRPGRTFDSVGQGRHGKEPPTDPRDIEKQHFIHRVVISLDKAAKRRRFDRLILVAPPGPLGLLRRDLTETCRARLTDDLGKDLTKLPVKDLEDALGTVLAV